MAKRVTRTRSSLSQSTWRRPDPSRLSFEFSIAQSVLEDFVVSHDPSDVLRELVQNEFDAEGTKIEFLFGKDSLAVLGNGKPVDASGWRRLSVVLGKGRVAGSDRVVEPKVNGIGSKNFGLRSLFLYGDQIFIRSGGRQTVLDLFQGAPLKPHPETESRAFRGIHIEVPFRTVSRGGLEPFDLRREQQALASFSNNLIPTLIKLARPGSSKDLRELVVTSERCNRSIRWVQSATTLPSSARNVTVLHRVVRVFDGPLDGSGSSRQQTMEEIEFQKNVELPQEYRGQTSPSYFKTSSSRIRIGVSLRVQRRKAKTREPGLFFYPIGVNHGYTGTAVSVNAPFQLNSDRSQILDDSNSRWNEWLLRQAAELTAQLLTSDWLERFGADAYLAIQTVAQTTSESYRNSLRKLLAEGEYWPTQALSPGRKKRPIFTKAENIVIPEYKELDGFLSDNRYLDKRLLEYESIHGFTQELGARSFTLGSLVRLRCSGKDKSALGTKLGSQEADFHYASFPQPLQNVETQERFARALDALSRRLSRYNRDDLKNSPSTLTADGDLKAPSNPLWVVNPTVASADLVPKSDQLHPRLLTYRAVVNLCQPFDIARWAKDVAGRAQDDAASNLERETLYRHIVSTHGQFDQRTNSILRKSPILKDHRGDWVDPSSVIRRRIFGARHLEPVLHFPHRDYSRDSELSRSLRFRAKVNGEDLLRYAILVTQCPELAAKFEEALWHLRQLLTPQIISKLSQIAFLRNSLGGLSQPPMTYLQTPLNVSCLGEETPFVIGGRAPLYKQLRCPSTPRSEDILRHLTTLREHNKAPTNPEMLYTTLVETLKMEKKAKDSNAEEEILWVGSSFFAPSQVLLGRRHRKVFLNAVPQIREGPAALRQSAQALGAHEQPQTRHWLGLLRWYAQKYREQEGPVTGEERESLREAYNRLPSLPEGVLDDDRILLDRDGFLHSLNEAKRGTYLIDDDPELAQAALAWEVPVAFADNAAGGNLQFYTSAGVRTLSEVRRKSGIELGETVSPHPRVNVDTLLSTLHSSEFASALAALSEYEMRKLSGSNPIAPLDLLERLRAYSTVTFVRELSVKYEVAGRAVTIPEEVILDHDRFVCVRVGTVSALRGLLSTAITEILTQDVSLRRRLADATYRLLDSSSLKEMERYLRSRGISWTVSLQSGQEDSETERSAENVRADEANVKDYVLQMLSDDLTREHRDESTRRDGHQAITGSSSAGGLTSNTSSGPTVTRQLPPIDQVRPKLLAGGAPLPERTGGQGRGGGGSWSWTPPTPAQEEWERSIGRRGEEIVYLQELARVKTMGLPESRVIWVSDSDPGADHDIVSVDEDGQDLWIEVKSTTGRDGRFRWPKSEFDLARKKRTHYVLYRVYEAGSLTPPVKRFRDPVGLLLTDAIHLDINSLNAEVEPLAST